MSRVHQVSKGGAAFDAGIKVADRIPQVGEHKIVDKDAFAKEFKKFLAGDLITLHVIGNDESERICDAVIGPP